MPIVEGRILEADKDLAWFGANPTFVLLKGEMVFLEGTTQFKKGDGVTQLQNLQFSSNNHFKGKYISLVALQTAYPTAEDGDYGIVDPGIGTDATEYIWDTDEGWVQGGGGSAVQSVTGASVDNTDPMNPVVNAPTQASFDLLSDYTLNTLTGIVNNKQPLDTDLTALAGIAGVNGDFIYREGGTWVRKTTAQVKSLLNIDYKIVKSNIDQSHTGSTAQTLLPFFITIDPTVIPITANTRFYLEITRSTNANANAKALGVHMNTVNNSLSGAVQIAHHSNPAVGAFAANFSRTFILVNSLTTLKYMNIGVGSTGRDDIQNMVAMATSSAMNFANTVYLLFSVTLANAADSVTLNGIKLTISNPDITL